MNKAMNATLKLNLRMFDTSVPANTTGKGSLSAEMKTFYDKNLLRYTSGTRPVWTDKKHS